MAFSKWLCTRSTKSMFVKIVYPGGHVEVHDVPILAAQIISKNPKCVVAHPQVFRQPWAVVAPETVLMPGNKFYVVPINTIRKLQELSNKCKNSPNSISPVLKSPTCKKSQKIISEERDDLKSDDPGARRFFMNKSTKTTRSDVNHNMGTEKGGKNRSTSGVRRSTNDDDHNNIDCGEKKRSASKLMKSSAGDQVKVRTRKKAIKGHAKAPPKRRVAVFDQWQPSLESIDETDDE